MVNRAVESGPIVVADCCIVYNDTTPPYREKNSHEELCAVIDHLNIRSCHMIIKLYWNSMHDTSSDRTGVAVQHVKEHIQDSNHVR